MINHGVKLETCESEISVRIESRIESAATIRIRIESADSRLQLQCLIFVDCHIGQMCRFIKNIVRSLLGY